MRQVRVQPALEVASVLMECRRPEVEPIQRQHRAHCSPDENLRNGVPPHPYARLCDHIRPGQEEHRRRISDGLALGQCLVDGQIYAREGQVGRVEGGGR